MSDADDTVDDEREAIRQRKREQLKQEMAGEDATGDRSATNSAGTPGEPVHVEGESHLQELTSDDGVVLVDYYADWCGPCKMLEPIVESIAAETDAVVAKVDVDAQQGLASQAGVRGVPTLVLYANGQQVERLVGMQQEDRLRSLVESHT